jgi:hypothetical protein
LIWGDKNSFQLRVLQNSLKYKIVKVNIKLNQKPPCLAMALIYIKPDLIKQELGGKVVLLGE